MVAAERLGFALGPALLAVVALAGALVGWGRDDPASASSRRVEERLVDVNRAGEAELRLLPGIGPAYARRIVEDRELNGPFADVRAVERIRGIGPRTVDGFEEYAEAPP